MSELRAKNALNWIKRHFSQVAAMIPESADLFFLDETGIGGVCTHSCVVEEYPRWSSLKEAFDSARGIPEGFFLAAVEQQNNTERLLVAWKRDGRKFWFRDRYALFVASTGDSVERTNEKFSRAVAAWSKAALIN